MSEWWFSRDENGVKQDDWLWEELLEACPGGDPNDVIPRGYVPPHLIAKHQGPGDHPGTGTPQSFHAGAGGSGADRRAPRTTEERSADRVRFGSDLEAARDAIAELFPDANVFVDTFRPQGPLEEHNYIVLDVRGKRVRLGISYLAIFAGPGVANQLAKYAHHDRAGDIAYEGASIIKSLLSKKAGQEVWDAAGDVTIDVMLHDNPVDRVGQFSDMSRRINLWLTTQTNPYRLVDPEGTVLDAAKGESTTVWRGSKSSESTLAHELGHAVDYKRWSPRTSSERRLASLEATNTPLDALASFIWRNGSFSAGDDGYMSKSIAQRWGYPAKEWWNGNGDSAVRELFAVAVEYYVMSSRTLSATAQQYNKMMERADQIFWKPEARLYDHKDPIPTDTLKSWVADTIDEAQASILAGIDKGEEASDHCCEIPEGLVEGLPWWEQVGLDEEPELEEE